MALATATVRDFLFVVSDAHGTIPQRDAVPRPHPARHPPSMRACRTGVRFVLSATHRRPLLAPAYVRRLLLMSNRMK